MSNGGGQGGTFEGLPVGVIVGEIQEIVNLFKKKEKLDPSAFNIAGRVVSLRVQQEKAQAEFDAARAAGERARKLRKLIEKLQKREIVAFDKLGRRLIKQPEVFIKAGFPPGLTAEQVVQIVAQTDLGRSIILKFGPALGSLLFLNPGLLPPPLATLPPPPPQVIRGGNLVSPFSITPSIPSSSSGDFGGFGGLLTEVIKAGGQIASAALAPRTIVAPQVLPAGFAPAPQQAGFGALVPLLKSPAARTFGTGAAGGVLGQSLFEGAADLFGGASTLDDTAAFTDPIPGSCRPKAHVKVNPCTGKGTWFTPRGRPLVFSGDLSACKRVNRVAKRLNKSLPLRKHGHSVRSRKR